MKSGPEDSYHPSVGQEPETVDIVSEGDVVATGSEDSGNQHSHHQLEGKATPKQSPAHYSKVPQNQQSHNQPHHHHHHHHHHLEELEERLVKIVPSARSTLYILIKYAVFLNWTLTGFWIIYNSSDYAKNAQIISQEVASYSDKYNKQSVVYFLIGYTITLSCITFFGLVGVCYENFCLTLSLAVGYAVYIVFDVATNALTGVPFNLFLILLDLLLVLTCVNLFFFALLIRAHTLYQREERRTAASASGTNTAPPVRRTPEHQQEEEERIDVRSSVTVIPRSPIPVQSLVK